VGSRTDLRAFLQACGADSPLALVGVTERGEVLARWSLAQPYAVIGRDPRCDVAVMDESVSRRHAYLQILAGGVFVVDLDSRTGLTLDGERALGGWLPPGGILGLGSYRLRLEAPGEGLPGGEGPGESRKARPSPLAERLEAGSADGLVPSLEIPPSTSGSGRLWFRVRRMLTLVGSHPGCRLRLQDEAVSRHHAALLRLEDSLWVVDLLSREGLKVEGEPVRWAALEEGNSLHVGRHRMIARWSASRGSPAPESVDERLVMPVTSELPGAGVPARFDGAGPLATSPPAGLPAIAGAPGGERSPEVVRTVVAILEPVLRQISLMQQQMFDQNQQALGLLYQMVSNLRREERAQAQEELDRIRRIGEELQGLQEQLTATAPGTVATPAAATSPVVPPAPRPPSPSPGVSPSWNGPLTPAAPGNPASDAFHHELCARIENLQSERRSRWQSLVQMLTGGEGGPN
jgi:pSer/pThr/pTyr-binding forkhead associated (FHA) protein